MVLKARENSVSAWAFFIGTLLAIILGITMPSFLSFSELTKYSSYVYAILVVFGILIGLTVNVQTKNSRDFLITGTILVIVSKFGMESVIGSLIGLGIGDIIVSTFSALLSLFVSTTIVVAIKVIFSLAKI